MQIIRPNKMKRKLREGRPVCGAIITILDPELVEIAGIAGLDYIWMDLEHVHVDWERARSCVLAAELHNVTPILRPTELPGAREYMIQCALNLGFQGVVLTGVRNPEEMTSLLNVMLYPPLGCRGIGHGRLHERAGPRIDNDAGILSEMNGEIFVAVLVEKVEAVEKIDAICAMDGVDAAGLGHRDYAMDAGLPSFDFYQEGMQSALQKINAAARRHNKAFFGIPGEAKTMHEQVAQGAQIFTLARDTATWKARCLSARQTAVDAGF